MTIYCFDLDGTLCRTQDASYELSVPIHQRIQIVNQLFDLGHQIIILTARGSTTGIDWAEVTREQLSSWGVKYHHLQLGKPSADFYIDDKGITDSVFFDSHGGKN